MVTFAQLFTWTVRLIFTPKSSYNFDSLLCGLLVTESEKLFLSRMAMAYHWDALRKQRVLDRKNEAIQRMTIAGSENPVPSYITAPTDPLDTLKSVDPQQFNQIRCDRSVGEITHDPNFKFRVHKGTPYAPIHVDPIYKIIYPGSYHVEKD